MTVPLWSPDAPTRCACSGVYRPRLSNGKLVKAREPAWRMAEQTRDPGCLQEQFRALAPAYGLDYQHHGDSRKSGGGYPDVHLWAPGRGSAYVELKRMDRGRPDHRDDPSPFQVRRMTSLLAAGHPVYLCRPCCLLVGVVDELMAEFAGVPCRYIKGCPAGTPPVVLADAAPPPAAVSRPARPRRAPMLPGAEVGEPFPAAVGYVVPLACDDAGGDAVRHLEGWLRDAGFPAASVPYPMRLVVAAAAVLVQVRAGLARAGADERVWRRGVPARPFPAHLVPALRATATAGGSSDMVAAAVAGTPHGALSPA